jgi:hypothetical protein
LALALDPKNGFDPDKTTSFEEELMATHLGYFDEDALELGNDGINKTVAENHEAAFAPGMEAVLQCKTGQADDGLPKFSNN